MLTRRTFVTTTLALGAATLVAPTGSAAGGTALNWKHFPAGPNGFFRAPLLLTGPSEAPIIDGAFTYPDGRAMVESVRASGKRLTAIYISQSDPDY